MSPMKNKQMILLVTALSVAITTVKAQNLLDILDKEQPQSDLFTQATFKANRILLGQSVETRKEGTFELVLGTRFWNLPNNESSQVFFADRFSAHFGLQYALSDRFTFGLGVTTLDGIFNTFGKYRLLRQKENDKIPFGLTLVQNASYFSRSFNNFDLPEDSSGRLSYSTQAIIARKFSRKFSLQLAPTYVHTGTEQPASGTNDFFSLGFGGRYKLGNHVSLVSEYYSLFGREQGSEGYDLFTLGINWEISDLIMQFAMTNSKSFDDVAIYTLSPNNFNFKDGRLHIGVNATYVIHFKDRSKKKAKK